MGRPATVFSLSAIEALNEKFKNAEEKVSDEVQREKAVEMLRPSIELMRDKGYTAEDVCEELKNGGVELSLALVKSMFRVQRIHANTNKSRAVR